MDRVDGTQHLLQQMMRLLGPGVETVHQNPVELKPIKTSSNFPSFAGYLYAGKAQRLGADNCRLKGIPGADHRYRSPQPCNRHVRKEGQGLIGRCQSNRAFCFVLSAVRDLCQIIRKHERRCLLMPGSNVHRIAPRITNNGGPTI